MASRKFLTASLYGGFSTAGRPWQISWHYELIDATEFDFDVPRQFANALYTQFNAGTITLDNVLSVGVFSTALEISTTYAPGYFPYTRGCDFTGTAGATDLLPEGDGPLILLNPGFPTADYPRPGRLYWPGLSEALQVSGAISDTYVGTMATFWDDINEISFTSGSVDYDAKHVLLSPSNEAKAPTGVDFINVSDKVARLSRRQRTLQGRST